MTAIAPAAGKGDGHPGPASGTSARVPWRSLAKVTWRQQRTALAGILALPAAAAMAMAAIAAPDYGSSYTDDPARVGLKSAVVILLQLTPVLAGLFIGAPLIAHEAEHGTLRLAWTQGADRTRWLLCRTVPVMVVLALAAAGPGLGLGGLVRGRSMATAVLQPQPAAVRRMGHAVLQPRLAARCGDPPNRASHGGDAWLLRGAADCHFVVVAACLPPAAAPRLAAYADRVGRRVRLRSRLQPRVRSRPVHPWYQARLA
jgi:hypothetical protein